MKHKLFIEHKGKIYQLKKTKKSKLSYNICKNKCNLKPGSTGCDNLFINFCGDNNYFKKVAKC